MMDMFSIRRASLALALALGVLCCAMAADWPHFRGSSEGAVARPAAPLEWNVADGSGIAWEVDLPGRGPSSPIVVGDRVFVTASSGARQQRLHVLCFDAESGEEIWHRQFWATGRTITHATSSVAANTPVCDGERLFAFFSSNDLVCLDLEGNLLWYRGLGYEHPQAGNDFGMSSSPVVVGDTVVVQVECQADSFAAGFDVATGETRWEIPREPEANWSSPIALVDATGEPAGVLLQSGSGLTALDAHSGEVLWQFEADCEGIPSSTSVDGFVYVPAAGLIALDARDASSENPPKVVWEEAQLQSGPASPLLYDGRLYVINRAGILSCADAASGEVLWRLRLTPTFWSSPVIAGDCLYVINQEGQAQVVRLGDEGELVATSEFGEIIQGTPAVVAGALYVRSDRHLWKIAASN